MFRWGLHGKPQSDCLRCALYDATGSYAVAFWICIACCVLSSLAIWRAAPRRVRAVAGRVPRAVSGPA